MLIAIPIIVILLIGLIVFLAYHHQRVLRDRAQLMRDAIRHRDFTFRLPTRGLYFGERALQEALNDMGAEIQKLVAHNEVESWQKLTRVLTHEIMNATTPIQSISQAYLSSPKIKGTPYEEGIRAIHDTSSGLATFVDSYRKLTQLQEPVPTDFNLPEFIGSITGLYPQVEWKVDMPEDLIFTADKNLLRQVVINLVKNAIEAGAQKIGVNWNDERLRISNDGPAIPEEVRREMFIPFFTTKSTGSGIGLSLSRQILMMQGMVLSLSYLPQYGYNVTFVIEREK